MKKIGIAVMGTFSFAQGVATAMMGKNTRAIATNKVAVIGFRVATVASTAATWLATAAQRALNTAFRANPIMFVVTLITGLVAAIVWLYRNNETARRIIDGAWNGIKNAVKVAWEGFIKPAIDGIVFAFKNLGTVIKIAWESVIKPAFAGLGNFFKWIWEKVLQPAFLALKWYWQYALAPALKAAWENIIKPAFRALGDFFKWVWEKVLKPAFAALKWYWEYALAPALKKAWENIIKPAFRALGDFFKWVWEKVLSPAFDKLKLGWEVMSVLVSKVWEEKIKPIFEILGNFVRDKVAPAFQKGIDSVKKIWDTLQDIAKAPVRFMVETVINKGLVGAFNTVVGWIPGIDELKPVGMPAGFAEGGWTGPGPKYQEAGVVHADEFVVKKSSQRSISRVAPGFLDSLNNLGAKALGYFNGGLVKPVKNGRITSGFGASRGKYPHAGTDFAVPVGTPIFAAMDGVVQKAGWNAITGRTGIGGFLGHDGGRNTYYGHLSQLMVKVGDMVKAGQQIALSGNTGRSTGPHLHFETWTGGKPVNAMPYLNGAALPMGEGGAAGGGNPLQAILDVGGKIGGWFSEQFPKGGVFADAAMGIGRNVFGGMKDWLGSKLAAIGDVGQDVWGNTKDFFNGKDSDVQAQVRGVANEYGWGSGRHWDSLSKLIDKESSWDPNAANPHSTARGLFQKMTSLHGPVESTPEGQARWGLDYIKGRYGDPEKAWAFHKRNNSYSDGGLVDRPILHDKGGVLNPGLSTILNASRKPEAILSNKQWADISHLALSRENGAGKVSVTVVAPEQATANEYFGVAKHQLAVMNRRGGGRG